VAADRRRLLLRTGRELFDRYGYTDVSITDITRAAGIATGSFYAHFPDKGEFFDAVLDELEGEGIREIEERVALLDALLAHMGDENIDDLLHDAQMLLQRGMGTHMRFPPTGRMKDQRRAAQLDHDDPPAGAAPTGGAP